MRYCKKCTMPDTRPGITFDSEAFAAPAAITKTAKMWTGTPALRSLKPTATSTAA